MKEIIVTAWCNGNPNFLTGSGLGVKIKIADRNTFFSQNSPLISLKLEGRNEVIFIDVSKNSFWQNCSEFINYKIGLWLVENGYTHWKKGNPHKFVMSILSNNNFFLSKELIPGKG